MKVTSRRAKWIGRAGNLAIRALGSTWRQRVAGPEPVLEPYDYVAFLHGHILPMTYFGRGTGGAAMISQHGDGELIAQVAQRLGFEVVRGSSSRGGARAVLEFVKRWGHVRWGVTPDGPRGPRGSSKTGAIRLAARSGRPVRPLGVAASHAIHLRSWDRFTVPLPFARIVYWLGEPMAVPADVDPVGIEALSRNLEQELLRCEEAAECELVNW